MIVYVIHASSVEAAWAALELAILASLLALGFAGSMPALRGPHRPDQEALAQSATATKPTKATSVHACNKILLSRCIHAMPSNTCQYMWVVCLLLSGSTSIVSAKQHPQIILQVKGISIDEFGLWCHVGVPCFWTCVVRFVCESAHLTAFLPHAAIFGIPGPALTRTPCLKKNWNPGIILFLHSASGSPMHTSRSQF